MKQIKLRSCFEGNPSTLQHSNEFTSNPSKKRRCNDIGKCGHLSAGNIIMSWHAYTNGNVARYSYVCRCLYGLSMSQLRRTNIHDALCCFALSEEWLRRSKVAWCFGLCKYNTAAVRLRGFDSDEDIWSNLLCRKWPSTATMSEKILSAKDKRVWYEHVQTAIYPAHEDPIIFRISVYDEFAKWRRDLRHHLAHIASDE